jgi:hypothetical protein
MLNPSDVYVSGGSNDLLVCWTDKVTKYDASSFYNWEQDNLPLHDLDERTHLLWEKFGHPTSALEGLQFIVSADATDTCNPLYFTTLSSCIAALPEVINYPILIEVASFGSLGGLNLSNKAFGPRGAIEIINRNCGFQGAKSLEGLAAHCSNKVDSNASYGLASSLIPDGAVDSAITQDATSPQIPALTYDIFRSKLYITDSNGSSIFVASSINGYNDVRYENHYVFTRRNDDRKSSRLTVSLADAGNPWTFAGSLSSVATLDFTAFDKSPTTEMQTYDVSTLDLLNGGEIEWGDTTTTTGVQNSMNAFVYFNYLDYIKVNDCNGPVYIRNFNVDSQHNRDRGIEIKNSKVHLERCSSSRANLAGLYVDNSEVDLAKGFVGYRNYKLDGTTRTGTPFATKRYSYKTQDSYGVGIYANNSTINMKSTYERDVEKMLQASGDTSLYGRYFDLMATGTGFPILSGASLPNPSTEALYCLSRNDIGIHAVNSNIIGGFSEVDGSENAGALHADAMQIFSELNTEAGIKLENSNINYSGRILLDGNYFGITADNSNINIDTLAARYNQSTAVSLNSSKLMYNKDLYATQYHSDPSIFKQSQIACIENGQDIKCNNSTITPLYTSSMPSLYGFVYTSGCFGVEQDSNHLLPSVELLNNSDVDFIHTHLIRRPTNKTTKYQYGLLAKVENNSTLTVRGSSEGANIFVGPASRDDNVNVAGVYVNDNSTLKVQGPTSFASLGVDVLAENNSNIEFTPHQNNNGHLLVSSFDLSNANNHTTVELHSTRSCLVANRNSNILMENLGNYSTFWNNGAYGSSINAVYDLDTTDYANYVSGGHMQFYPNANYSGIDSNQAGAMITGAAGYVFQEASPYNYFITDFTSNDVSTISTGGMCVRALENSLVQANNVHFPAGWDNADAVVYDFYGNDPLPGPICSRLFIWNIADNSLLKSSYLTVSGFHPRDAEYSGPSGEWVDYNTMIPLSGAPATTPDTGILSVLDYYGKSVSGNPYNSSSLGIQNYGPFRLYFSTDPAANFLVPADGGNSLTGFIRQVFAQGYNFSGSVSALSSADFEPSAQYKSLLNSDIEASGFYYASSMVTSPDTIKAILDDSALNAFANAKHNTVGKSGLPVLVRGYYPTNDFGGDSFDDYDYSHGVKSFNNFDLKKDN